MVDETRGRTDLRARSEGGLVGYCRSGEFSGYYLLVISAGEEVWNLEFSHPTPGEYGAEQFASQENAWAVLERDFVDWGVVWAPAEINDRALFRLFQIPLQPTSSPWSRRRAASDADVPLLPILPETDIVRRARHANLFARILRGALAADQDFALREGFARFRKSEAKGLLDGTDQTLDRLLNLLWDAGHTLAIVPINASVVVRPLIDPWEEFRSD